jgi:flagellar biosynthesis protein FlhG
MNWTDTRRKLLKLAAGRSPRSGLSSSSEDIEREQAGAISNAGQRPLSLCIASGKGGTGKSIVTAALAAHFAERGRTLLVDADFGVGNAHILQDVSPELTCVDVIEGRVRVAEAVAHCGAGLDLLAAGSGVPRMAELSSYELHLLASGIAELEPDYRTLLVDSAAGVSHQTLALARACDALLVVTTSDLTAMTDAYAFLKLYFAGRAGAKALLLVNRAASAEEAEEVTRRIARVGERFLGIAPRCVGWLPHDPIVSACVNRRGPVTRLEPGSEVARALRTVAATLGQELAGLVPRGFARELGRESRLQARLA